MSLCEDTTSVSFRHRQDGNVSLKRSREEGISPVLAESRLQDSVTKFNKAYMSAESCNFKGELAKASAQKNIGVALFDFAKRDLAKLEELPLSAKQEKREIIIRSLLRNVKQITTAASKALQHMGNFQRQIPASFDVGERTQEIFRKSVWKDKLVAHFVDAMYLLSRKTDSESWEQASHRLDRMLTGIRFTIPDFQFVVAVRAFEKYLKAGTLFIEKDDIKAASRIAAHMQQVAVAVEDSSRKLHLQAAMLDSVTSEQEQFGVELCMSAEQEARILLGENDHFQAQVLALRDIDNGSRFLGDAVADSLDVEMVWTAIDMFRNAVINCREKNIELEAQAHSLIGRCYTKCLQMRVRGKNSYQQAIVLGLSMAPCVKDDTPWFKEARNAVLEFQTKMEQNDATAKDKRYEPYKEELKDVLKAIKDAATSSSSLLTHVYEKHPPKNPLHKRVTFTENEEEEDGKKVTKRQEVSVRAQLRKSLVHYHPDKNEKLDSNDPDDIRWEMIAEECYKQLSNFYNNAKGV
eukprot:m.516798 g.516798  ORF g.516798 m.516798 type:complete len:521 (-) comp21933_c0_seq1:154-1716(-)